MLTDPNNLPFVVALGLMLALSVLEVGTMMLGAGLSGLIDGVLPDFDFDADIGLDVDADVDIDVGADVDLDADADVAVDGPGLGLQLLDWLHVGRVPTLVLLLVWLTAFGLTGLGVQAFAASHLGGALPPWAAVSTALVTSLFLVHFTGGVVGRLIPGEESSAIEREGLVGRFAVIVTGTARTGNPAQAKLHDEHGQVHYVLVEPETDGERFESGSQVILITQEGALFKAVGSDLTTDQTDP